MQKKAIAEIKNPKKENTRLKEEPAAVKAQNVILTAENAALKKENQLLKDDNERIHGECSVHLQRYLLKNTEDTWNTWSHDMSMFLSGMNHARNEQILEGFHSFTSNE